MSNLIELIKDSEIKVLNVLNWGSKKDRYTSGSLPNMISHIEGVIEGVIQSSEGLEVVQAYNESLLSFKLPTEYVIHKDNLEFKLQYRGSDAPANNWYSKSRNRLLEIAFERELKREVSNK